jgi:large subunit ribosomal protein L25
MLKEVTLEVEIRETAGKIANRKLKAQKRIPAIIYGGDRPAVPVTVSADDMEKMLREHIHENTIFHIKIPGSDQPKPALIHDYQIDTLSHRLLHIDFLRIDMETPVHVKIPVILQGIPAGVKVGGLQEFLMREVGITCLPKDIPESITLDISPLELHASIKAGQLSLPEGVKLYMSPETAVVRIVAPRMEVVEVAPVAAAGEAAEPEVIGKGKKEAEEGEEGEEGKPAAKEGKPAAKEGKPAAKEGKPAAKEGKPAAKAGKEEKK